MGNVTKVFHTDALLRKHKLLIKQNFRRKTFSYVDSETEKLAEECRITKYENEATEMENQPAQT
jgi:hypothetical protein